MWITLPQWVSSLLAAHTGRTVGLLLLLLGQSQYVSWESRPVLGRWSYPAAAALGLTALLLLASTAHTGLRLSSRRPPPGLPAAFLDLGYLLTGAAYLGAALDDPGAGGRILELNLLGSLFPPAIGIEWLAIAAFVCSALACLWVRWRERSPAATALALSLGCIVLLGESAARLSSVAFPRSQGFPTASTQLWFRRWAQRNEEGFRDRPHLRRKRSDTFRILLIGDSFTFGQGIDRTENRVSEQLEARLTKRWEAPVEVINAGLPFTHTLQHIECLRKMLDYTPDLVVLLYVFNDIYYLRPEEPRSLVSLEDRSVLGRLDLLRVAFENSFLAQQVYVHFRHLYWRGMASMAHVADPYESPASVRAHVADLRRFVALASGAGVPVRIAPFNPGFALKEGQGSRRRFIETLLSADLPVWPLRGAFDGLRYEDLIVSDMDHHPNERAHARLAQALADEIADSWAHTGPMHRDG